MQIKTLTNKGLVEKTFEVNEALDFLKENLNNGMWVYINHKPVEASDITADVVTSAEDILLTSELVGG